MRTIKLLVLLAGTLLCYVTINAQTFTWNGSTSSDWNTGANWTPNGIPGAGNTVIITNSAAPFFPQLPGNTNVTAISCSNSTLNLAGHTLTVSGAASFTNCSISTGSIAAANFNAMTGNTFTGAITLTKTGGGNNIWVGGNTFQSLVLTNNDDSYIRIGSTTANTFNGNTRFVTTNGYIDVSYSSNSTFNGNVTIDATGINGIRFGASTGVTTIATGYSLLTNGYTSSQLTIRNLTQNGTVANGSFSPVNFTPTSCIFGGSITVSATAATITSCQFRATNNISAANLSNIRQSTFSSVSGTTTLTKTAGGSNTWYGGNTFHHTTITNAGTNQTITIDNTAANTFNGTSTFNVSAANRINIANTRNATFNGNVFVNSTSTAGIYFGASNGITSIASGYALLTSGFSAGNLYVRNVTQNGTATNGSFSPTTFTAINSTFNGNFTIASATTISLTTSTFNRTNAFTATNVSTLTGSSFSATTGSTTINKTGGTTDTWAGNNTFRNTTIANSSSNVLIRIGTTGTTTFNGTTRLVAGNANYFQLAYTSNVAFNGNVYLDCTSTNGIYFGTSTGSTTIASGFALLTNGFTSGTLNLTRVTQDGSTANGVFTPAALTLNTATIRGNFTAVVSGTATISTSTLQRTNSITAATFATMANNNFSATSGTTTLTKTGSANELWTGGNTFYNTTVNNNGTGYIRFANTNGDTYFGTNTLALSNTGSLYPAYNGATTYAGNLFLNNTGTGGIYFSASNGTAELASGYALKTSGYSSSPLTIDGFVQLGTAVNDSFRISTLVLTNSTFGGELKFNATTATLTGNTFTGNNRFYSGAFTAVANNNFSGGANSTLFTKRGSSNDTWAGNNTFGNVTLHNRSNGRIRMANSTRDIFVGTLIVVQDSTGAIEVAYNGANEFGGNISTIGSTTAITLGAGTGSVVINGNTAQSILGPPSGLAIRRLTMNTSGTLTLKVPVSISTTATFTNGVLVSDATNLLVFNDNATATSANSASYVRGPVRKIGNDAFIFPVGGSGYYAPIAITAPAVASDHFTAQYFHANPNDVGYDTMSIEPTIEGVSTKEYWILDRTNGTSAVRVTMYWDTHSGSILDMTALRVARWNGSTWVDHGFSNFTGTNASGSVTSSSTITNFSPFTFGSSLGGGALPVELTAFNAEAIEQGVMLHWTTAVEINNDYFLVERSVDGVDFQVIGKVDGAGNSSDEHTYAFLDAAPTAGLTYYRLQQVDMDGEFEISPIVGVMVNIAQDTDVSWDLYPNPTTGQIQITGGEEGRLVGLEILDQHGRSLQLLPMVFGASQSVDISTLQPGSYVIRVITPDHVSSKRFIKL